MKATICFTLSELGQKASLLAGGDGKASQAVSVESTDPAFTEVVRLGTISTDGTVRLGYFGDIYEQACFSTVPTIPELLAAAKAAVVQRENLERQAVERRRAATLAVLDARNVRQARIPKCVSKDGIMEESIANCLTPDWPTFADESVKQSIPALPWLEELRTENTRIEEAATAVAWAKWQVAFDKRAILLAAEAEEAARIAARRAELGLKEGDVALKVEEEALTQVPSGMWDARTRGKNWMAIIGISPSSPGGLSRDFIERGKGDYYYILPEFSPGQAIEFGADYYTGSGKKVSNRWHGFVVRQESDALVLRRVGDGKTAVKEGIEYKESLKKALSVS